MKKRIVLQNVADPLYINVGSLIEYVTSGSAAGDMVVVAIDEATHKVTASVTDGTITKAKLDADLVAELEDKVNKSDVEVATDDEIDSMLTEVFGASQPTA